MILHVTPVGLLTGTGVARPVGVESACGVCKKYRIRIPQPIIAPSGTTLWRQRAPIFLMELDFPMIFRKIVLFSFLGIHYRWANLGGLRGPLAWHLLCVPLTRGFIFDVLSKQMFFLFVKFIIGGPI